MEINLSQVPYLIFHQLLHDPVPDGLCHVPKAEYNDYQSAVARWKQQTGNKAESDSLKAKLQRKQQEVKERENNRQSHYYRKDRGGR